VGNIVGNYTLCRNLNFNYQILTHVISVTPSPPTPETPELIELQSPVDRGFFLSVFCGFGETDLPGFILASPVWK